MRKTVRRILWPLLCGLLWVIVLTSCKSYTNPDLVEANPERTKDLALKDIHILLKVPRQYGNFNEEDIHEAFNTWGFARKRPPGIGLLGRVNSYFSEVMVLGDTLNMDDLMFVVPFNIPSAVNSRSVKSQVRAFANDLSDADSLLIDIALDERKVVNRTDFKYSKIKFQLNDKDARAFWTCYVISFKKSSIGIWHMGPSSEFDLQEYVNATEYLP